MAAVDDESSSLLMIDETYEFSAPRFFDFIRGETADDEHRAELWFETATSHAPSPCMLRIRTGRTIETQVLCDFSEAENTQEAVETKPQPELVPADVKEDSAAKDNNNTTNVNVVSTDKEICEKDKGESLTCTQKHGSISAGKTSASVKIEVADDKEKGDKSFASCGNEACTPIPLMNQRSLDKETNSKKHQKAKKIASLVRNPSALKPKNKLQSSHVKTIKPSSTVKKEAVLKNTSGTPHAVHNDQAIKRQKLGEGRSRQILGLNSQNFPHKTKLGLTSGSSNLCFSAANKTSKEGRKLYVREPVAPFISTAEMMKKFQSSTRNVSLPQSSHPHTKGKLTLTRPKEPEFETAHRVRSVKMKSSAELEEEMMAKIPKFKARPVNKKILNAPTLPALPRSALQPPEFHEFHLETMARANQNAETASVASTEVSHQNNQRKAHQITEPRTPVLHTLLRARPPKIKSSVELEQEELEKAPKFKARPLNKKIFESKGELGIFSNAKKQITIPREFNFATNERIIPPPAAAFVDLFDKLSLNSESHHQNPIPRNTKQNPFHLHTEERGAEKERRFITELVHKQIEEERARVPKANPYPYTTDYPTIPPKPKPKQCTKPEPFQLESLVRHEEEMQREMEERQLFEREEAERRIFKAQPILKEDPLPVSEKARIPLTEVQEFNLLVGNRAVERAEFDQKIKEKETMYKRYRDESEAARMVEEEKALKQMRRTMVPHARPLPKFDNPFCPKRSSKEATKPKSPKLRLIKRREIRKHVGAAASSPASFMR